jgi:hypothetical protein
MKKQLLFIICLGGYFCALHAQFGITSGGNGAPINGSVLYPDAGGGISGYVRGSAYGGGQNGGSSGSNNYNYATTFAEAALRADFSKSTTEGYTFFKGEVRVSEGQYFNGTLDNTTGTTNVYKTDLKLRDLYAGYRSNTFEISFGNQNIQWGRGIGSNPTNNISPSNSFLFTANGDDQKMYNLMAVADYKFYPNLDLQVVAVPMAKSSTILLNLFNLGQGITITPQALPDQKYKNGAIAARLNLSVGPFGGSLSYFNGYDPSPSVTLGYTAPFTGAVAGSTVLYRKQTFGGDFGFRIPGKTTGTAFEPTNDMMIAGELAYNHIANPDNLAYIPQSNLAFSLGVVKMVYAANKIDKLTIIGSWYGKYTPNYATLVPPTDPTQASFYQNMLDCSVRSYARMLTGQQKNLDNNLIGIVSQSFMRAKLTATLVYNYSLIDLPGSPSGHNRLFSPRLSWNFTKTLSATAGALHMWGPSSNLYGPIVGGYFCELKANF